MQYGGKQNTAKDIIGNTLGIALAGNIIHCMHRDIDFFKFSRHANEHVSQRVTRDVFSDGIKKPL